jgi:hypothetical protein
MSKLSLLEKKLKNSGEIGLTSWHIMMECRTTSPQKLVQNLKERYGYDKIRDKWEQKTEVIDGTKTVVRWKRYFWNGGEND